jgi:hypothetical protein
VREDGGSARSWAFASLGLSWGSFGARLCGALDREAKTQILGDVDEMIARGLIEPRRAREYFARVEPELYRFPAVDAPSFRRAVDRAFAETGD